MIVDPALREAAKAVPARRKVPLAIEIVRTYLKVRWLLLYRGLPATLVALRRGLREHSSGESEQVRRMQGARIGHAVVRVLRVLPTDGRCLMRSLVLAGLLARRGVYAKLIIGVTPDPRFEAHAWVEVDALPVLRTDEQRFHRLVEL
jgi:transglutaminase superfamily protein